MFDAQHASSQSHLIFLLKPKILLADEPASMIYACGRATILDMLMQLSDEIGMTVIFITHDIGLATLNTYCAVNIGKGDA